MKRKYSSGSDSSHYFYSTDSGTDYSAPPMHRSRQKKRKRQEMRDYELMRRHRDPVTNELLFNPRLDRRLERYHRKRRRREEAARTLARMAEVGMSTSSGSEFSESPTILQGIAAANNVANWTQAGRIVGGLGGLAVGGIAGEQIGEAIGGAAGLTIGALRNVGFTNKNMTKNKAAARRVDKSAMVTTGKAKVRRVKTVKVSPYLKKAVKQVMAGNSATGFYRRSFAGMIGVANKCDVAGGGLDEEIKSTLYGTAPTQTVWYIPGSLKAAGQKNFFGGLLQGGSGTNATYVGATDFNFFTPGKIWHAASVLFNNKPENIDPYVTARNLSTTFITDTGVPVPADAANLKIDVKSSSVTITMRNMSARTVFVDIYECTSKLKFHFDTPLEEAINLCKTTNDGVANGQTSSIVQYNDFLAERGSDSSLLWLTDPTVDSISVIKDLGYKWKYKKHSMMLASGEICTQTISGPSGMLDFQKLWNPTREVYDVFSAKDWSKHLMISTRPDFALRTSVGTVNKGQRLIPQNTAAPKELFCQVAVEVQESYQIKVPEVAGYVLPNTGLASHGQPLNLRRKRIQITNLTPNIGTGALADLSVSTEFNPVATTTSSLFQ